MVASIGTYGAGMSSVWSSTRTRYSAERDELAIQDRITRGGEASVKHNRVSYIQKNNIRAERAAADGVRFSVNRLKEMFEVGIIKAEQTLDILYEMRDIVRKANSDSIAADELSILNDQYHSIRKTTQALFRTGFGSRPDTFMQDALLNSIFSHLDNEQKYTETFDNTLNYYVVNDPLNNENVSIAPDVDINHIRNPAIKGAFNDGEELDTDLTDSGENLTHAEWRITRRIDLLRQLVSGFKGTGGNLGDAGAAQSIQTLEQWENFRNKKDAVLDEAVSRLENNDLAAESKRLAQAQAQKQRSQSATQIALQQMNISAQMMASTANTITNNWNRF